MKKITITKESGETTIIHDDDNSDIIEYATQLSQLMSASNISLLETSEKIVIIRPHKIEAIDVVEIPDSASEEPLESNQNDSESSEEDGIDEICQTTEEHIDIIKDASTGD